MIEFLKDVQQGIRGWSKSPGVILVTVASLGLGIGVATTVFTVANSLLFVSASGLSDPERLIRIYTSTDDGERYGASSFADFEDLGASLSTVQDMAASSWAPMPLGSQSPQRIVLAENVTWNYFSVLGIEPTLGRAFGPQDESAGDSRLAVVSHEFWTRELERDPRCLGRTIELGARTYTIVGVAPAGLDFGNPLRKTEVWLPLPARVDGNALSADRGARRLSIIARRNEAASLQSLRAELDVAAANLHRDHPKEFSDDRGKSLSLTALPERESRLTPDRRAVVALLALFPLAISTLILLIACSNVATLFLARAEQRARETAVRLALGASRWRLVLLFVAEGLVPGFASGALGIGLAWALLLWLRTMAVSATVPVRLDFGLDARVVGFAAILALGCTLAFGVAPALAASTPDLVTALKSLTGGDARRPGRIRWRQALVVVQVSASFVLVVGSGLFYRSLQGVADLELGFDPGGVALTTKARPGESSDDAFRLWTRDTLTRLRSRPGVVDAHASTAVELTMASSEEVALSASLEGEPAQPSRAFRNQVTPGYLGMLDFALLRGRALRESDRPGAERVAVINDVFADRFWPGEDVLGRRFRVGSETLYTVVGMVKDGKLRDIDDPPAPYFWTSLLQGEADRVVLSVKGGGDASAMVDLLRREIDREEGELARIPPRTLESLVDLQFVFGRLAVHALGWGGAFGVLLAAIGIFGIVSFSVACRSRELAIRVAVGAARSEILRSVVREGLALALVGLAVGLAIALPLTRLLRAQLLGISPADPETLCVGAALLLCVAFASSVVPARRAAEADPVRALREG